MSCFNAKLILAISSLCLILNEANLTVAQVNPWNKVCKTREINILQKRVFDLHVDVLWIKQHLQQRESASKECGTNEFTCAGGDCIDIRRKCDGRPDCRDQSDEADCPQECSANEFACASGDCIDVRRTCDGRPDCRDQSDEADCQLSCPLPFELIDGSCYFFSRIRKSWDDAQKDCMVSGANLVALTSEQESQAVWNRFKRESTIQDQDPNVIQLDSRCGPKKANKECNALGNHCCSGSGWCGNSDDHCNCTQCTDYREVYGVQWIGLKRDSEGNFNKWVSGDNVNYTAWATHTDGVVFEPTGDGNCVEMVSNMWNDINCTMQTRYTCEKAATTLQSQVKEGQWRYIN